MKRNVLQVTRLIRKGVIYTDHAPGVDDPSQEWRVSEVDTKIVVSNNHGKGSVAVGARCSDLDWMAEKILQGHIKLVHGPQVSRLPCGRWCRVTDIAPRGVRISDPSIWHGWVENTRTILEDRMILAFTLSMPNRNSWNGGWSGEDCHYIAIKNLGPTQKATEKGQQILAKSGYHYNFGDGWSAHIDVKEVDAKAANRLRRKSDGFCGYDWMVESILDNLEIRTS